MAARSESGASFILIFVLFISTHLVTTKSSFVTSQKTIPPFSCLPPGTGIWGGEIESGVAEMDGMRCRGSCGTCSSLAGPPSLIPGHI